MSDEVRLKKGFTLIELLAVIVIIAVIALITYPVINRVITNSRMTALKNSAEALLKETNLQTAMDKIGDNTQILITDERLKLKNNQFTSGFIFKNSDGKLELKNVTNGYFCINGTSGHLKVEKGNCNYSDTTGPTLVLQTGYIGATEAMVLAQGSDNESGIRGYEYKIGDGDYTDMQDDNFYQFENLKRNTSYKVTVRVTNGVGLTTEKSITFKTKNISAATFVVSDADRWTNKKDVTINYPNRVSGVTYRYKIGNGSWQVLTSGKKKELEVKENTMIYAEVVLNGETVSSNVSITKIDNTPPVIASITPDTTAWKRQVTIQVIASDTPSGIAGYSFDDGATWTNASTYTTTKNGTYKIKVKDYANNITSGKITISNIDRTGPKCVSSGGSNTWTNQSRTIIGTCIDDGEGAGCVERTVSRTITTDVNAKMSPGVVKDVAGNETTCPATEMVKVDKTKPTCTVSLSNTNWTNKPVTVYGKCKDALSGCVSNDIKKTYSQQINGKVTIGTIKDKAGNETTCTSTQNVKIDTTPPTCTSTGGSTTWTSGSRTITGVCNDTGGSGCKGNISYTYNAAANTNWNINNAGPAGAGKGGTVYDKAGNSASCPANQAIRLDRKNPTCTVTSSNPEWTNGNVTLTGKCSDDGSGCKGDVTKTYTAETNGKYSPGIVYDNVGNKTTCPATGEVHIDKTAPNCPSFSANVSTSGCTSIKTMSITITPTSDTKEWEWFTNSTSGWTSWGMRTGTKTETMSSMSNLQNRQGKVIVKDEAGNTRECLTPSYCLTVPVTCSQSNYKGCSVRYTCKFGSPDTAINGYTQLHNSPSYSSPAHILNTRTKLYVISESAGFYFVYFEGNPFSWHPYYGTGCAVSGCNSGTRYGYVAKSCTSTTNPGRPQDVPTCYSQCIG